MEGPPFPRGRTWSTSSRTSEPQIPPSCVGHWHLPSSRARTARFTRAGTEAFRFACLSTSSSKAAVSTCSSVAFGWTCDCPAFAFLSSARNSRETVRCIRLTVDVIGSITVRAMAATGMGTPRSGWGRSRPTGWTIAGARSGISVTTVLLGTTGAGRSSATSCFASWREQPKKRGSSSARFSSVITLESSLTTVMQSFPSRIGPSTSGKRRTIRAPTCR